MLSSLGHSFSNSAFFDRNTHPSLEDQVVLCRQIARQLVCDESNAKSKGREMFEKRVQKSSKWVTTATTAETTADDDQTTEESFHERTVSDGPPNLRLVLDPRHVQDLSSLDFETNESEIIRDDRRSKSVSKDIVTDLTSPEVSSQSKGKELFQKRKQKSEEWIVEALEQTLEQKSMVEEDNHRHQGHGHSLPPPPLLMTHHQLTEERHTHSWLASCRDFNARARPFVRSRD